MDTMSTSLGSVSIKAKYQEDQTQCHNIVVEGIEETADEKASESEEKVRKLLRDKLQLDHRAGMGPQNQEIKVSIG